MRPIRLAARVFFVAALTMVNPANAQQALSVNPSADYGEGIALIDTGATADDIAEGVRMVRRAADSGHILGEVLIADILRDGKYGVAVDLPSAVTYYRRAADAGNRQAMIEAANLLQAGGEGLAADFPAAASYYELAVAQNDNRARRSLATMLLNGSGVERNIPRALRLLDAAIASGDVWATINLANAYRMGQGGLPQDGAKALELLAPLVEQGNAVAISAKADIYRTGSGSIDKDSEQAAALFRQATELGDSGAARKLADMLVRGIGTPTDFDAGIALLLPQAESGNPAALVQLGDYYAKAALGHGDGPRAVAYYQQAIDAGYMPALVSLGDLNLSGGQQLPADQKAAESYYERAIEQNINPARTKLASLLLKDGSNEEAINLLNAAVDGGDPAAAELLGTLFCQGKVVTADFDRALELYNRAKAMGASGGELRFALQVLNGPLAATHREDAMKMIVAAADAGQTGAAVTLAQTQLKLGTRSGNETAIDTLIRAAKGGDASSAIYLIQLRRDGIPKQLTASVSDAAALIEQYRSVLGPDVAAAEDLLLDAVSARKTTALSKLATAAKSLSATERGRVIRTLRWVNENAYVYLLQQQLHEAGEYDGSVDGRLTRSTIAAFNAVCSVMITQARCPNGPFSVETAEVLSAYATLR